MNEKKIGKEFRDFSVKHLGLSGTTVDDVVKHMDVQASRTPYILEEREMRYSQLDVFSRLLVDRQIFLSKRILLMWVNAKPIFYINDV